VNHSVASTPDAVTEAIRALSAFRITTARDAAVLLGMWERVEQLTAQQRAQVIAHYAPVRPGVLRCVVDRQTRTGAAWIELNHG